MVFEVHRADRSDLLAEGLAQLLRDPLPDPFARELVIVPARGVERWLSQRLSHRLGPADGREDGVCAGVDFRSPGSLVAEVLGTHDDDPWAPDALVWPLLEVVDASMGESWCHALAEHLGHGREGEELELRQGRRYAVARRLARLFASYAVQRPSLLVEWAAGRDTDGAGDPLPADLAWQAELWRRVVAAVGQPTPADRHRRVCELLADDPERFDLPPRLSLFGHTRIPVSEVELLRAIGVHRDVHLWLPHPSDALWRALADERGVVPRAGDDSHQRVGHPLAASLGRDLRELERLLVDQPGDALPVSAHRPTLLGRLQADIAANAIPPTPRDLVADDSISVHACHGPARQVEVLREVLLGLLADDPTLEPRDILVMCPDIETYAPLVSAAFGLGDVLRDSAHPGQHLRVRLADRALTQTNPLLAVAMRLLDLAGGRAEASRVLDLMSLPPVRRRFAFSEPDLERLAGWTEATGIRWAFDAAHRSDFGLDGYLQNTWRFGLDRVLSGVAVSDDAARWFGPTLPFDDVSSSEIDLAGRFAECIDRLQQVTDRLTGAHPVAHWVTALTDGIESLTSVGFGDEWQLGQVQRELAAIGSSAEEGTQLRLADVRSLLAERFTGRPTRANFRTGTLTVCTMTPMRSVPHRVVALLGLDDGVFPRAGAVDGDDVLARRPLTGERDARSEDRQLMLDALMAASEHLVITYTGANESTGQPRPPAVPLQELLDALDLTAAGAAAAVVRKHPLQAFDARNLEGSPPFSFDRQALQGAYAAAGPRVSPPRLVDLRLAPPTGDIDVADLVAFFKAPARSFLRKRLGLALPDDAEPPGDAIPVEVNGLEEWAVGERMLRDVVSGRSLDDALQQEWRRGELPPGRLGWRTAQRIALEVRPIAELVDGTTQGMPAKVVDVDVAVDGRRLVGAVPDVHGDWIVTAGYSRLGPKHELDAWVKLVVLSAARPGSWGAAAIGRGRKGSPPTRCVFPPLDDPQAVLRDLVALYDAGMSEPLPLPLKTAHAYAARRLKASEKAAEFEAAKEWAPRNWDGENAELAHVLLHGPSAPLDVLLDRLDELSARLWRPILEARHS